MLKAEIRRENGLSTIYVEGQPIWPMTFCSRHNDDAVYTKKLQDAGIKVFWPFCDTDWQVPGAFEELKAKCDLILGGDPEALLMIRVSLNPPKQWMLDNPDELVTFEGRQKHFYNPKNKKFPGTSAVRSFYNGIGDYSMASHKWANDACRALDEFIDKVEASSFGHRVMGYFLNAGGTEEWYYGKMQDRSKHCMGFSPAFHRAFIRFLREKYDNDVFKLRAAWNNEEVTFEHPPVPPCKMRYLSRAMREHAIEHIEQKADFGSFLDPDKSQWVADFYEAWNAGTGYSLLTVAKFIKDKTQGKALVGAFYGCQGCVLYQDFGTSKASMALESPHVDFLSAPTNYEDRVLGGCAAFTNPVDSMHLRAKCWVNEDDNGTCLQQRRRWVSCLQTKNVGEDIELMKRDFARNLIEDAYSWWFENSRDDKWWDHPDFFPVMARMQEIFAEYYGRGRSKNSAIACLYDEESIWYTDNETCKDAFQWNKILELSRIGAPADHYFLEDILLDDFPADRYKVYVVLNAAYINEAKRAAFREKIQRNGNAVVWVYAGGFMCPGRSPQLSMDWASELTGMTLDVQKTTHDLTWGLTRKRHAYTKGLSRDEQWGRWRRPINNGFYWALGKVMVMHPSLGRPLFFVRDKQAVTLGRFYAGGKVALAAKDLGEWTSVFVGSKAVPSDLLRNIAREHGAHIYNDANDVFYANNDFFAIHPAEEGERTIVLPREAREVREVFDGTVAAKGKDKVKLNLEFGTTKAYRTEF